MAHVLVVTAFELGHPVLLVIAMVTRDSVLHARTSDTGQTTIGRPAPEGSADALRPMTC